MLETILSIVVALISVGGAVLFPKLFAYAASKGKEAKLKAGLEAAFVVVNGLEEAYANATKEHREMLLTKGEMGILKIQKKVGCDAEDAALFRDAAVNRSPGMGAAEKVLKAAMKNGL